MCLTRYLVVGSLKSGLKSVVSPLLLLISIGLPIFGTVTTSAVDNSPYEEGQFIIQIKRPLKSIRLTGDFNSYGLKPVRLLSKRMNIWLYEFNNAGMNKSAQENLLESVKGHSDVVLAQFNHKVTMRSSFPNDPSFNNQWALHNTGQTGGTPDADIDAPEAWDSTTGGMTVQGDEIIVAVIDGGFDLNHPDLSFFKNTLETPGNGIDDDGNGYIDDYDGWNAYNNNGNIPGDNHGTHVSGIAAATGNNSTGVSGVNWGAKVLPVAGGSSNEAIVVAAYGYVLEMRATYNETDGAAGAFVVSTNSSFGVDFGDPANYPIWCAMYDSMGNAGIISCGATANLNINIDASGDVPTACASNFLLSVTNTTSTDSKNSGAAYGLTTIDLGAPGTSIFSTLQGGNYGYLTGTSMATPHVAGAVALMYDAACSGFISAYKNDPSTYALVVRDAILDGTDPNPSLSGITVTGGRLNISNSVNIMRQIMCGVNIDHFPLTDTKDTLNSYEVICTISSDTSLSAGEQLLHFDTGFGYELDTLEPTGGLDEFHAFISAQSPGTDVDYFLTALDDKGAADTTQIFNFRVIDYDITLAPSMDSAIGGSEDSVWYNMTVTNIGLLDDSYDLAANGNNWNVEFWNETGTFTITNTPTLSKDSSYNFQAMVAIPFSYFGEADTVMISAISTADNSHKDTSTLITTSAGEPIALPLDDEFPLTTFNPAYWIQIVGASISTAAMNEPSSPYALNLNGSPTGRDTIVSQVMDFSGESTGIVSYWYQRTGGGDSPENGDNLYSQYLDSSGIWQTIAQHNGAGPDMSDFAEVFFNLPGDAFHNSFQIRFRNISSGGGVDDWFIDNIFVGPPPDYAVAIEPSIQSQYGPSGDTTAYIFTIYNNGLLTDAYTLESQGNNFPISFWDESGTLQSITTDTVSSGDSLKFVVKVYMPGTVETSEADTGLIRVVSQNDTLEADEATLITISSGPPGSFPWFEPFPDSTLSTFRWVVNDGGEISSDGLNPPSVPFSLNLDGANDTLESQTIDLSGQSDAVLSYYWQRGGNGNPPETGDTLKVAYKNNIGNWITLKTYLGQGGSMKDFAFEIITLPVDAAHSAFQLRLTSYGSGMGTDDWFIDDIRIDNAPAISITPTSVAEMLGVNDSTEVTVKIDNVGQGKLIWSAEVLPAFKSGTSLTKLWESGQAEPSRREYTDNFLEYDEIKGSQDSRTGYNVERGFGGPDNFGYVWVDSDESGGPEFNWIEISSSGTNISAGLEDENYIGPYSLGFSFPFYDSTYNQIFIGSNGIIGFSETDMDSRLKTAIPNSSTPNNMIAWFWDDLDITNANNPGSEVFIDTTGNRCVIQFNDYPEYAAAAGDVITAQVILESTGSILIQYLSVAPGFDSISNAVGIENFTGTDGLEVVFLSAYVHDSLALLIEKPFQWYDLSSTEGEILGGESDSITLKIKSEELESGIYNAQLVITNNDPDSIDNPIIVPLELTVNTEPPYVCGDIDNNGQFQGVLDLTYLVNYIFRLGPPLADFRAGDIDGTAGFQGILELNYLVNYIFRFGSPPDCQ